MGCQNPPMSSYHDTVLFLTRERAARGLSLSQVARKLGKTKGAVAHWEYGTSTPPPDALEAWAEVLGYDLVVGVVRRNTVSDVSELLPALAVLDDVDVQRVAAFVRALSSAEAIDREMLSSMVDVVLKRAESATTSSATG